MSELFSTRTLCPLYFFLSAWEDPPPARPPSCRLLTSYLPPRPSPASSLASQPTLQPELTADSVALALSTRLPWNSSLSKCHLNTLMLFFHVFHLISPTGLEVPGESVLLLLFFISLTEPSTVVVGGNLTAVTSRGFCGGIFAI